MKQLILFLCMTMLLGACSKTPTPGDVVGIWTNVDGAELILNKDGQFTARLLPQNVFFRLDKKVSTAVAGKGIWKLKKTAAHWEVRLSFKEMAGQPANYGISVLVSGSGSSTYLYEWKGEEGEGLYKLNRKFATALQDPVMGK